MFAWTFITLVALASAKPQFQATEDVSPKLESEILQVDTTEVGRLERQLPLNYQTVQGLEYASPIQYTSAPVKYSTSALKYSTAPLQTVQYTNSPVVQTLQTPYAVRTVAQPQQYVQYQTAVPAYNSISGLAIQPAQVRVAQVKPVTQLRTQTYKTVVQPQTLIQRVAPLKVKTVAPVVYQQQVQVPQVRVQVPQVRVTPQVTLQQKQYNQYTQYADKYQGAFPNAPQGLAILRQVQDQQLDGYAYAYETENGIKAQEEGRIANAGTDAEANIVQGSYSYVAPDGTPITVNYVADENGFRAEGEHIPKPSEEILRSIEYQRSLPPRPEDAEGQYVRDSNGF